MASSDPRLLVVEDENENRRNVVDHLRSLGFEVEGAENALVALDLLNESDFGLVISDLRMPHMDGLELLREVRRSFPEIDVIVVTAFGGIETAIEAIREGAVDYLAKPFGLDELELRVTRILELRRMRREVDVLRERVREEDPMKRLVGESVGMRRTRQRIRLFAPHRAPVLITGETGTGKEVVASLIHRTGDRTGGKLVPVPCGAIPAELAESELFGHERGAFTGAVKAHAGCFERAHGGTLLLDDIDDLPSSIQVKLLRVLQDGTLRRVGGDRQVRVDVRLIATSKEDLAGAVEEGRFREDLYYRIRGLEIELPPLRERGEDVLLLSRHFLRLAGAKAGRVRTLSSGAARRLMAHAWPGNVRELVRTLELAAVLAPGDEILEEHLPDFVARGAGAAVVELHLEGREQLDLTETVEGVEKQLLEWALERRPGNVKQAAQVLGIPRSTFQTKLGKYDLGG